MDKYLFLSPTPPLNWLKISQSAFFSFKEKEKERNLYFFNSLLKSKLSFCLVYAPIIFYTVRI